MYSVEGETEHKENVTKKSQSLTLGAHKLKEDTLATHITNTFFDTLMTLMFIYCHALLILLVTFDALGKVQTCHPW
jgi:hypothetical protein